MIKVLIADDERRDRHIVRLLLERQYSGMFEIMEAENGVDTLEKLKAETPELVLLDINMPGQSGIEVLRGQTEIPYVIMLTAYNNFEYTREALRLGVRDYLLKPPVRAEFYKAVDQFLKVYEHETERSEGLQCREVFTRDLAQQLFYLGNMKKIRGLLNVLDIRKKRGICGTLTYDEAHISDPDPLLDAAEEFLEDTGKGYAATFCSSGIAVALFFDGEEESRQVIALISRLASTLECDFCVSLKVNLGLPAELPEGFPQAFQKLYTFSVEPHISAAEDLIDIGDETKEFDHDLFNCSGDRTASKNDAVAWICEVVNKDCSKHWSIDVFSRMLYVSPFHLSHQFKEHIGCCFTDYLTQVRIERAVVLMQTTNMSLAQISDSVGYLDPNYFSRVFKKIKGASPREYSRNLREK